MFRASHTLSPFYERLLLALSAAATVLILVWFTSHSRYGIDFTDESYYLVMISDPFLYSWSLSQFGFIYHPLYRMLDGDIASMRLVNILFSFLLAWALTDLCLKALAPEAALQRLTRITAAGGLAIASLCLFNIWVATPSYNSLNLQGILIASIGLLLAEKVGTWKSVCGWFLLGIGGWLCFMAKPSTALALAVGSLLYLMFSRKFSSRFIWIAIASAVVALLIGALLIDGSLIRYAERLQTGMRLVALMGGGHSLGELVRLDDFYKMQPREVFILFTTIVLVYWATWPVFSGKKFGAAMAIAVSIFCFAVVVVMTCGLFEQPTGFGKYRCLLFWSLIFSALLIRWKARREKIALSLQPSHRALAVLFLAMPHLYAFGTNHNYWYTGSHAAVFWLLVAVILLSPLARLTKAWAFTLPLVLVSQAISAAILQTGLDQPWRQPQALRLNDQTVEIGAPGSNLILSEGYAHYFLAAKNTARQAGLQPGTPVIDLTGQSPGILYALRAKSIGQAWMIGGYRGSNPRAAEALRRVACEDFANAWLLVEQDGPKSLSIDVLSVLGAKFPSDYAPAGTWTTAAGAGGFSQQRVQTLFKPTRPYDASASSCEAAKSTNLAKEF